MKPFDYAAFHAECVIAGRRTDNRCASAAAGVLAVFVFALVIAPAIAAWFQQVPG